MAPKIHTLKLTEAERLVRQTRKWLKVITVLLAVRIPPWLG